MVEEEIGYKSLDIATDEQKESIEMIQDLDIGNYQKAELILIILGLKPATELLFYKNNKKPEESVKKLKETKQLHVLEKKIRSGDKKAIKSFAVAKSKEEAKKVLTNNADEDQEQYGRSMGYPETAVTAFLDGEDALLDEEHCPDMEGIIFDQIRLSKKHYKEEITLLKYWSDIVNKYAPKLYNELNNN